MRTLLLGGVAALLIAPAPALAVEVEDDHCPDFSEHIVALKDVEPKALAGLLTGPEIACLEIGYAAAKKQTDKSKISRVLLANAMVNDTDEWMRLVKRHLEEVEQSDPDITYLYANFLFNQENPDYAGVIKYADVSYERRADRWQGDTFTRRSHHLLRLRALARMKIWEKAEEAALSGSAAAEEAAAKRKLEAHTAAREWLDFDRASDIRWTEAAHLCAATGSEAACGLKAGWRERSGS